jgi:hypothetical protein
MLKTNLSDIFSDLNSESSVILPKSIKIKNINSVDTVANTTSSFMPQKGAYSDATSSFMPQKGGYLDATSSFMPQKGGYLNGTKNKDIQQLISMLSATSDDNYTANSTANSTDNTEQLKDKLFNIIQNGGVVNIDDINRIIDIMVIAYNEHNETEIRDEYKRATEEEQTFIKKKLIEYSKDSVHKYYKVASKLFSITGINIDDIVEWTIDIMVSAETVNDNITITQAYLRATKDERTQIKIKLEKYSKDISHEYNKVAYSLLTKCQNIDTRDHYK